MLSLSKSSICTPPSQANSHMRDYAVNAISYRMWPSTQSKVSLKVETVLEEDKFLGRAQPVFVNDIKNHELNELNVLTYISCCELASMEACFPPQSKKRKPFILKKIHHTVRYSHSVTYTVTITRNKDKNSKF